MEEWRPIPGLPLIYEASSLGRLRRAARREVLRTRWSAPTTRIYREKIFKLLRASTRGYKRIRLVGKTWYVHRLIAAAFVPNPDGHPHVNHLNGRKTDNRAVNLEWVTDAMNKAHWRAMGGRCADVRPAV